MGFDISGNNPKINTPLDENSIYGMIESIDDFKDRWTMQDNLNEVEKEKFWKEHKKYQAENPGIYFRNNVWWWRPLWQYVCHSCDDFLTERDMLAGAYNDGRKISKTKAKKISDRLTLHLDTGIIDKYKENHDKQLKKMEDSDDEDIKFMSNYPFDRDNVKKFAIFCKESGGFTVC